MKYNKEQITELVIKAKNGNETAVYHLVQFYQRDLLIFGTSLLRNHSIACEIVQDSLITAFQEIHKFNLENNFKSWIFSIVKNKCMNFNKSAQRRESEPINENHENLHDPQKSIQIQEIIHLILSKMEEPDKEILLLVDFQGFSYEEASKFFEITEMIVKVRLRRARTKFLEIYKELDVEITGYLTLPSLKKQRGGS